MDMDMDKRQAPPFPLVVVGASAGGVEALWGLLEALPVDLEAAVVVVMHLAPRAVSHLGSVLQRRSCLPVMQASTSTPMRAGHVYVAPADQHVMVDGDVLRLTRGPRE